MPLFNTARYVSCHSAEEYYINTRLPDLLDVRRPINRVDNHACRVRVSLVRQMSADYRVRIPQSIGFDLPRWESAPSARRLYREELEELEEEITERFIRHRQQPSLQELSSRSASRRRSATQECMLARLRLYERCQLPHPMMREIEYSDRPRVH